MQRHFLLQLSEVCHNLRAMGMFPTFEDLCIHCSNGVYNEYDANKRLLPSNIVCCDVYWMDNLKQYQIFILLDNDIHVHCQVTLLLQLSCMWAIASVQIPHLMLNITCTGPGREEGIPFIICTPFPLQVPSCTHSLGSGILPVLSTLDIATTQQTLVLNAMLYSLPVQLVLVVEPFYNTILTILRTLVTRYTKKQYDAMGNLKYK